MKGWERDLLDHLTWLAVVSEERDDVSREELVARLKREFPALAAAGQSFPRNADPMAHRHREPK
jgi:hypothetical protein